MHLHEHFYVVPEIITMNPAKVCETFPGCLFLTFFLSLLPGSGQTAQTNSWIKPSSGNWEDSSAWSLGILPNSAQSVMFTNAGWKAVQLTHDTAVNFPGSMTVGSITVSSPPDTLNTLIMSYVGVLSPLSVDRFTLNSNSTMLMLSSALQVGTYLDVNGTFNQGEFSGVSARVLAMGNGSSAAYNLSNGTLNVSDLENLGISGFPTVFNQDGGYHYAGSKEIPGWSVYNLRGGQLGGRLQISGGRLEQSGGDLHPDSLSMLGSYGLLVQSGGTSTIGTTTVGSLSSSADPPSSYILSNGILFFSSDVTIGSIGVFDQEGGSNTIIGTLQVQSDTTRPFAPIRGKFTLNRGMLATHDILVWGVYGQGGGTNRVAGDLTILGVPYSACDLDGGWLTTSNTYMQGGSGNFIQTGGRHQVAGTLRVTGGAEPAYGLYGGEVIAPTIEITYGTFAHYGGTVSNASLLRLSGWWEEFAGNQKFGQLQVGTNDGSLWLGTNAAILRFSNSSAQAWGGGILHIRNWSGSPSGGGGNQVIFGNSSAGLTPAQVAQIRFDYYPSTQYPAKILPTGEVVPNQGGTSDASTLSLKSLSTGGMQLTIAGTAGRTYEVQVSTNLSNWLAWTQVNSTGTNSLVDTNTAGKPRRFYRARLLP